jgi:hypothetical protein
MDQQQPGQKKPEEVFFDPINENAKVNKENCQNPI